MSSQTDQQVGSSNFHSRWFRRQYSQTV